MSSACTGNSYPNCSLSLPVSPASEDNNWFYQGYEAVLVTGTKLKSEFYSWHVLRKFSCAPLINTFFHSLLLLFSLTKFAPVNWDTLHFVFPTAYFADICRWGPFFFSSLSGITIGHVALLLGRMMRQTMSLIGFWENDADVSTFWVRPVERSPLIRATLGVPAWAAKRKWNLRCILHTFFYVYAAWFLTKKPTWPDVWKLKYIVLSETYCLPSCNCNGLEIEEPKC